MRVDGYTALKNTLKIKPNNRHPDMEDSVRSHDGLLFPSIKPGFSLTPGSRIFTIGSCFARNIEAVLAKNYELPTADYAVPKSEWAFAANGILNEYNPACISQRLLWAADNTDTSTLPATISGTDKECVDLLLAAGNAVTLERALERRREIDQLYAQVSTSDLLVITLGLNECWYDEDEKCYLNRNPPPHVVRSHSERYRFEQLSVETSYSLMEKGIEAILDAGVKNIMLTVSPVPLQTSFSGQDCVIANSYSKATMRCVAEKLRARFTGALDYFPSYEIVTSGGLSSFQDDHVHVKPEVVEKAIEHLLYCYEPQVAAVQKAG